MEDDIEQMAGFVRSLAKSTRLGSEDDLQRLAAYLFALATLLWKRSWDASWDEEWESFEPGLAASLAALGRLSLPISPRELYKQLIGTLVAIEDELAKESNVQRWLLRPGALRIPLEEANGQRLGLVGEVALWLRPRSLARNVWELARQALEHQRHPPVRPLPPAIHLERLAMHWQDSQLPSVRPVRRSRRIEAFDDAWASRGDQRFPLKVALCPLTALTGPRFDIDKEGLEFAACRPEPEGLRGREELENHLVKLFDSASKEGIHLFVFPELSIDQPARQFLAKRMAEYPGDLLGVIAGSFHICQEPNPSRPVNEAVLLDGGGDVAWRHEKRGHFAIPRDMAEKFKEFFRSRPVKLPHSQITEGIRRGDSLNILETRIGRLCLLICSDVTDSDCDYREVVRRIRPDFLFIVSLSPETERFGSFARELKDLAIGTLFVNAACACGPGTELALADLAFWAEEATPPTQVRWRADGELERYDFATRKWKEVDPAEGVSLLPGVPALVIDLGAFFRHWLQSETTEQ